nr:response regulator [Desulfobacterales bacterium]
MPKANILVVEDEGIVAKDIQVSLEGLGYAVPAIALSGKEAVSKARELQPDLVLMDIMLRGGMNGIEAADSIREDLDIPVVYLTAYADAHILERAKVTEPFSYIVKPFDERELYSAIEIALYRHKLEKELKETKNWLATILRSIGDAVIATDRNGSVTFMNPVAESLTGWKEEEALNKELTEVFNIISEKTRKPVKNPVYRVLREGTVVGLANHTVLIARNGTEIPIDDCAAPVRDGRGGITGVVLVFRDITVRKRMEEELLKSQKLESVGILAGGIAHDFNNILMAILGNISMAKVFAKPGDKVFERLSEAEKASLRARDLTQQLLTFSRGGRPVKKQVSISELIQDSVSFALAGSDVGCEFSLPDNLWPVEVDDGQISQVINNLVINADQAMPEGGIIKVRGENITVDKDHPLPVKEGRYVKVSIEDQGIGIPKEHLSKVFDPYFTTKQKGSGLGLATSYSILKNHGGYISVESELNVGTIFHIYLPALREGLIPEKEVEEEVPIAGRGRVLVMDDEDIVREVAGDMLTQLGYEVESAKDGVEAIELYKKAMEAGKSYDVVILDLTVPGGMGGKEAIQRLLEIDPEVKGVVSSGYSNDPIMAEFRRYGFTGVVAKPYRIKDLSEVLARIVGRNS